MRSTKPLKQQPRGIRNNNPLNIRIGNTWLGEVPNPTDSDFEQFVSPVYGLRAAFCILRRYIRRYGRNTVRKIVYSWAPSNENNCDAYIKIVCQQSKLDPDETLLYEDAERMWKLVQGMALAEVGQRLDMDLIMKGYQLA